jgi:hypothetical protein
MQGNLPEESVHVHNTGTIGKNRLANYTYQLTV